MPTTSTASSNDSGRIIAAKPRASAGALTADIGTKLPKDATEALADDFEGAGFVTEEGMSRTEDRSNTPKKEWGGLVVFNIDEGTEVKVKFALMEYLNARGAALVYGPDNVVFAPADASNGNRLAITMAGQQPPRRSWVFDMVSGKSRGRLVLPDAQVTSVEDITFAGSDTANRGLELSAYPDADGNVFYEYWDDGKVAAA